MGDPARTVLFETVIDVVEKDKILDNVQKTGFKLLCGLKDMQKKFPHVLHAARGRGFFLAIDACNPECRGKIIQSLRKKGKMNNISTFTIYVVAVVLILSWGFFFRGSCGSMWSAGNSAKTRSSFSGTSR